MLHVHLIAWLWLIGPLGLCRATQVVLHDRIFDRPRRWVTGQPKLKSAQAYERALKAFNAGVLAGAAITALTVPVEPPKRKKPLGELVAYLFGCPWCISLEVALLVVVLLDNKATAGPTLLVLLALTLSLCAVVLDRLVDKFTPDDDPEPPVVIPVDAPAPAHVQAGFRSAATPLPHGR